MTKRKKIKKLTSTKAKLILSEGEVRGHKLTKKQRRLFGLIAGGRKPTRIKRSKKNKRGK